MTSIDVDTRNDLPPTQVVRLQYFKATGKWYAEGEFLVPSAMEIHSIWELIEDKRVKGTLPGLAHGSTWSDGYIVSNCPEHRHDHPRMFLPIDN